MAGVVDAIRGSTDEQLVVQAQKRGEPGKRAFDVLVDRFHQRVYRQLYHLLRSPDLADDVTQETFVKAYLVLPELREPATFPAWLRRIATRLAFNARRDAKTRSGYEEGAEQAKAELGGQRSGPEAYVGASELVWMTLGKMSYPYREILVLRYLEELTVEEIAAHLDLGKSAAKMRLKRARDEFKALADSLGGGNPTAAVTP
jgi:RNA polymerase sigma-70 factor (ECF subfamily)